MLLNFGVNYIYRDNVDWDEEQEKVAREKVELNSQIKFSNDQMKSLEDDADKHWDAFYDIHQNRFVPIILVTSKIILTIYYKFSTCK